MTSSGAKKDSDSSTGGEASKKRPSAAKKRIHACDHRLWNASLVFGFNRRNVKHHHNVVKSRDYRCMVPGMHRVRVCPLVDLCSQYSVLRSLDNMNVDEP